MYRLALGPSINNNVATSILGLSRVSSIGMLIAYAAYLFFQLKTHRQFFESSEEVSYLSITSSFLSEYFLTAIVKCYYGECTNMYK